MKYVDEFRDHEKALALTAEVERLDAVAKDQMGVPAAGFHDVQWPMPRGLDACNGRNAAKGKSS